MINDIVDYWQNTNITGQIFTVVAIVQVLALVALGIGSVLTNPK